MTTTALHIDIQRIATHQRGRPPLPTTALSSRFDEAIRDLKVGHDPMTKTALTYASGGQTSGKSNVQMGRLLDTAVADGRLTKVEFKGRTAWIKAGVRS